MRKEYFFALLVFPVILNAQIYFSFENTDLSKWHQYPDSCWDTSAYKPISGNSSLKHIFNNSLSGTDRIATEIKGLSPEEGNIEWQFSLRYEYAPSSSNNWSIFLLSDADAKEMIPSGKANGYAVGVNYTGYDDILKLYKISEGKSTEIINTGINWEKEFGITKNALFRVSRSKEGGWQIHCGQKSDSLNFVGSGSDEEFTKAYYMGIYYKYSSTQDMKLWIDDIMLEGVFIEDTTSPTIAHYRVLSKKEISIEFNETLQSLSPSNFSLGESHTLADSIRMINPQTVVLYFETPLISDKSYCLFVDSVSDIFGNRSGSDSIYFSYHQPVKYDIVLNEIMFDPSPVIGLPDCEYIEIFNRSEYDISLNNWKIMVGSSSRSFSEYTLKAKSYVILCSSSCVPLLSAYGTCIGILSSALNNEGQKLSLLDDSGNIISTQTYCVNDYQDNYKSEGGWSLEIIDCDNSCRSEGNSIASTDSRGGTPGRINSVYSFNPDTQTPYIQNIRVVNDSTLIIAFNEAIDSSFFSQESFYISPDIKNQYSILECDDREVSVHLQEKVIAGMMYSLELKKDILDCSGNKLNKGSRKSFALPLSASAFDMIINEVMFAPQALCPEYVEIYNRSSKVIDLGKLEMATLDVESHSIINHQRIADTGVFCFPKEYIALTNDTLSLKKCYTHGAKLIQQKNMPSLYNDEGIVSILHANGMSIDEFHYHNNMHLTAISNTTGIALERIRVDEPSQSAFNWHSASTLAGYATPALQNSQYLDNEVGADNFMIHPEVFSPNNDGFDDVINIFYHFEEAGKIANISVFDASGQCLKHLTRNAILETQGVITWDGTTDNLNIPVTGIYLIYIEVITTKGEVKKYKRTCVLNGSF